MVGLRGLCGWGCPKAVEPVILDGIDVRFWIIQLNRRPILTENLGVLVTVTNPRCDLLPSEGRVFYVAGNPFPFPGD